MYLLKAGSAQTGRCPDCYLTRDLVCKAQGLVYPVADVRLKSGQGMVE